MLKNMIQGRVIGSYTVTSVELPNGQVVMVPTPGQMMPNSQIEFSCENVHRDGKVVGFGKVYTAELPPLEQVLQSNKSMASKMDAAVSLQVV
jgi:hypothetical protein